MSTSFKKEHALWGLLRTTSTAEIRSRVAFESGEFKVVGAILVE